jgi:hypothetical protein
MQLPGMANPAFAGARIPPIDAESISRFMDIAGLSKLLKRQTALPQHCRDVFQNVWLGLREKTMRESLLPVRQSLHPVEAEIVRIALRLPAMPDALPLDLWNLQQQLPATVVHLTASEAAEGPNAVQGAAAHALARMVRDASDVPSPKAPACAQQPNAAKSHLRRARLRYPQVRLLASILLEVQWAGDQKNPTGSEVYRLAWLPGVDKWLVTASADFSVDGGYRDHLLAAMDHQGDVMGAACQVIRQHWQRLRVQDDRGRWSSLRVGRIDGVQAAAMADAAWPAVPPTVRSNDAAVQQRGQPVYC